jgi:hypothetical protein
MEHIPCPECGLPTTLSYIGLSCENHHIHDMFSSTDTTKAIIKVLDLHDELVNALREAEAQIIYPHGKFKETGSGNRTLAQIGAVLQKVDAP